MDGKIIIYGNAGEGNTDDNGTNEDSQQELELGRDYAITDASGKIFNIDENGNITDAGTLAKGGGSNPQNTDGVDKNGKVSQYTAEGVSIEWKEKTDSSYDRNTQYAFDTEQTSKLGNKGKYPKIKTQKGKLIYAPFKAVVNGKTDRLEAIVHISDDKKLENSEIVFKTTKGKSIKTDLEHQSDHQRKYTLTLQGTFNYAEEEVIATIVPKDSLQKQQVISSFTLVHLEPKKIKLSLVPLDEKAKGRLDDIKKNIIDTYKTVGVEFDIQEKEVLDISSIVSGNTIDTEDKDFASTYSKQQNVINALYPDKEERYVLFVTSKNSSKNLKGYFRLNGQFGYIFSNADEKTPAHEVGHGVFKLEHPWTAYKTIEGKTNLLMDYSKGQILSHLDWKQINDPKLKLYAFQRQSEGEIAGEIWFTPDWKAFTIENSKTINSLKGYPRGTVPGVFFNGTAYTYNYEKGSYVDKNNISLPEKEIKYLNLSDNIKQKVFLYVVDKSVCKVPTYSTTYEYAIQNKEGINYSDTSKVKFEGYWICDYEKIDETTQNGVSNYSNKDVKIDSLLTQLNLTSSKTGIKGRIFITDNSTSKERIEEVQNEINELKKSKEKAIYIWAKDYVDEKTFSLEVAVGGGFGDKQIAINNLVAQTNTLKNMPWMGNFNPLTAIFDGLAELVSMATIPPKFYNPEHKEYNPFPAQLYGAVSGATLKDTIFGVKDNTFNTAVLEFAYVCGLWNGTVNTVAALPEGASFVVKMITNENDTRTKTFDAINNLSIDTITQMAEQEWQKFSGLNPALKAEKTGRLSIEVVTIVASVTKIGKVSKAVNFIDELDAVSNVAKLAGKVIKPVVNAGSKSVKFVLTEGVQLIKRYDISFKVDGNTLYCGFPGKVSISIVDKLKNKTPEEIRKIPTDENGNRLVEIDNEPVLIGTKEGLEKVNREVATNTKSVLDNIAKVTEKQLNDIYIKIQQNIPFEFIPNTLEHKAQRWVQYKESGGDWNYSRWSNTYNANMDKARSAHKKVTKYYDDIKFNCTTKNCKEVSVDVIVNGKLKKRRLDIGDENPKIKKGIEIKSYETGKVYATKDILQEIEADKYLIEKDGWNIEWVFIETEISKPLEKALKNANIKITFK